MREGTSENAKRPEPVRVEAFHGIASLPVVVTRVAVLCTLRQVRQGVGVSRSPVNQLSALTPQGFLRHTPSMRSDG